MIFRGAAGAGGQGQGGGGCGGKGGGRQQAPAAAVDAMNRNSLTEMSGRIMHMAARVTLNVGDDLKMMQEMFIDGMNSGHAEGGRAHSIVRLLVRAIAARRSGQAGSKGSIGGVEQPKGPAAEGIALFLGGQRNHPVDHRHGRPAAPAHGNEAGGERAIRRPRADDAAASAPACSSCRSMTTARAPLRAREVLKDSDGKPTGKSREAAADGVATPRQQEGAGRGRRRRPRRGRRRPRSSRRRRTRANAEYKHEGDSVNTEVRCTGSKVQIMRGDTAVATYDKGGEYVDAERERRQLQGHHRERPDQLPVQGQRSFGAARRQAHPHEVRQQRALVNDGGVLVERRRSNCRRTPAHDRHPLSAATRLPRLRGQLELAARST